MEGLTLEKILTEVCAWCPFAYCHDTDCGVAEIRRSYNTNTVNIKEVK